MLVVIFVQLVVFFCVGVVMYQLEETHSPLSYTVSSLVIIHLFCPVEINFNIYYVGHSCFGADDIEVPRIACAEKDPGRSVVGDI